MPQSTWECAWAGQLKWCWGLCMQETWGRKPSGPKRSAFGWLIPSIWGRPAMISRASPLPTVDQRLMFEPSRDQERLANSHLWAVRHAHCFKPLSVAVAYFIALLWPCCSCLVAKLCPTLATPWALHGILWARILEWLATSFPEGFFSTQELNPWLCRLHCRQVLYCWATDINCELGDNEDRWDGGISEVGLRPRMGGHSNYQEATRLAC